MSAEILGLPAEEIPEGFPSVLGRYARFMRADAQGAVPRGTVVYQGDFYFVPDFLSDIRDGYFIQVDKDKDEIIDLFTCYLGIPVKETLLALDKGLVTLEEFSQNEVWDIPNLVLERTRGS